MENFSKKVDLIISEISLTYKLKEVLIVSSLRDKIVVSNGENNVCGVKKYGIIIIFEGCNCSDFIHVEVLNGKNIHEKFYGSISDAKIYIEEKLSSVKI